MSTEYTDGLRALADFFDSTENAPTDLIDNPINNHYSGDTIYIDATCYGSYNSEAASYEIDVNATQLELAKWLDALGTDVEKKYNDYDFSMVKKFGPHKIRVVARREVVCKRVVTGTEEIAEQIIPAHTKEITETVCAKVSFKKILADNEVTN